MIKRKWAFGLPPLLALAASPSFAEDVCPAGGTKLTHVELYDGPIAEMAQLAPEKSGRSWEIYVVGMMSGQKRPLTVRCSYKDGTTRDVVVNENRHECRADHKDETVRLVCK